MDIENTRPKRPKGRFGEKIVSIKRLVVVRSNHIVALVPLKDSILVAKFLVEIQHYIIKVNSEMVMFQFKLSELMAYLF